MHHGNYQTFVVLKTSSKIHIHPVRIGSGNILHLFFSTDSQLRVVKLIIDFVGGWKRSNPIDPLLLLHYHGNLWFRDLFFSWKELINCSLFGCLEVKWNWMTKFDVIKQQTKQVICFNLVNISNVKADWKQPNLILIALIPNSNMKMKVHLESFNWKGSQLCQQNYYLLYIISVDWL